MARKVSLPVGREVKKFTVIERPHPHIVVESRKELHGWWRGKRECTGERLLVNPYNGCSVGCVFCYARALPAAYFRLFTETGIVTVFRDFDRSVREQLDSISVASCGYLSPVCDPFQDVNRVYRLSEKIVAEFVERNIPIEFITKCEPPDEAIMLMRRQKHSFGQFSAVTAREDLRRELMKGGATVEGLFASMEKCAVRGLPVVLRIDPVIPLLTDSRAELALLVEKGVGAGARHVVASVLDIPAKISQEVFANLKTFGVGFVYDLRRLYSEAIDGCLHARIGYRKRIFDLLRNLCEQRGITFALCMEYEMREGRPWGLNGEFMSSTNCEGMNIPVYERKGSQFAPSADCSGACLMCADPRCGIEELAMGVASGLETRKDFVLSDYRRWSKAKGHGDRAKVGASAGADKNRREGRGKTGTSAATEYGG